MKHLAFIMHSKVSVAMSTLLMIMTVSTFAESSDLKLYALRGALWTTQQIPVCWENPTNQDQNERGWVQNTVSNTWAANSSLTFTGWGQCQSNSRGIRIRIADDGPHTKGLGTQLDGIRDGMVLNFTFNNFSRQYCQENVPGRREHCIRVIAMHEFGHALSFAHEQNRADAPEWCQKESQGTNGDVMVTDFDLNSVMNYCSGSSWPNTIRLSNFDILGLQRVYGRSGGRLPSPDSIFAINLAALHSGCNSINESRSPACVSAIHRVCSAAGRGGAGVSQEVGKDIFGVACFNPSKYGDVSLQDLKSRHSGCDNIGKSQHPDCMAAVHRWCHDTGNGGAGIVQEVGNGVFGVACFNPISYQDVSLSSLKKEHSGCNDIGKSQRQDCVAAVHRWCVKNGKGTTGLVQKVGAGVFGVACFNSSWYGDVALH